VLAERCNGKLAEKAFDLAEAKEHIQGRASTPSREGRIPIQTSLKRDCEPVSMQ